MGVSLESIYALISSNLGSLMILFALLICISIIFGVLFIVWCWVCVYSYEKVKCVLQSSSTSHKEYDMQSKKVLQRYKNRRVTRIHICRHPLSAIPLWFIELVRQYKGVDLDTNILNHYFLILEIQTKKGYTKLLQLDKGLRNVATLMIQTNKDVELESVEIKSDLKLGTLIQKTMNAWGKDKYFNWDPGTTCIGLVCEVCKELGVFENLKVAEDIRKEQDIATQLFDLNEGSRFALKTFFCLVDSLIGRQVRRLEVFSN